MTLSDPSLRPSLRGKKKKKSKESYKAPLRYTNARLFL